MPELVDQIHEPKRAEDFSKLTRIGSLFLKFNWLFSLIVAFFIMLGFGFETPQAKFDEVNEKLDRQTGFLQQRIDSLQAMVNREEQERERILTILEGVAIDVCERRRSETYVYRRLDCQDLLNGVDDD